MKFKIYISHGKGEGVHTVEVTGASRSDGAAVTQVAARHFGVSSSKVLALPSRDAASPEATLSLGPPAGGRLLG